eukprot:TRINITY_DN17117_c0_g1_i1.p2 TRINITY_DN17117_c0_g1~~TRINITY_DN17117_c0_g1_i1.p2  ORF type:complete len:235 (-),score=41.40 TRINITY_DN17117_c0_g1_i1:166-870(-)
MVSSSGGHGERSKVVPPREGVRIHGAMNGTQVFDMQVLASRQGLARTGWYVETAAARDAKTLEDSHVRFRRHDQTAKLLHEMQDTLAEITGRKVLYPNGWADIENPLPGEENPHMRSLRLAMPAALRPKSSDEGARPVAGEEMLARSRSSPSISVARSHDAASRRPRTEGSGTGAAARSGSGRSKQKGVRPGAVRCVRHECMKNKSCSCLHWDMTQTFQPLPALAQRGYSAALV